MLNEWLKAISIFLRKGYQVITKDVNNNKFSTLSIVGFHIFFLTISLIVVICLPKGINSEFMDYIKDIFAIFIGFFITALTLIYDKLNITKVPTEEEQNDMPANERPSYRDILRMRQEHNYVVRFFYSIGFNVLFATLTLLLLIPIIFWKQFFFLDISEYEFINDFKNLNEQSVLLGLHIVFLFVYRIVVILLIVKVFFYSVYMITSLLHILISKKKI